VYNNTILEVDYDKIYVQTNLIKLKYQDGKYYLNAHENYPEIPYVLFFSDEKKFHPSHKFSIFKKESSMISFFSDIISPEWFKRRTKYLTINMAFLGGPNLFDLCEITPDIALYIIQKTRNALNIANRIYESIHVSNKELNVFSMITKTKIMQKDFEEKIQIEPYYPHKYPQEDMSEVVDLLTTKLVD
jgi:hypothetical protein